MEIARFRAARRLLAPAIIAASLAPTGCGRPETGDQMQVTDEEIKERTKLMDDAMKKSGAYPGMQ